MTNWPSVVLRGCLLSLLWWILTDGVAASWWIGGPAVTLAVFVSIVLLPPARFVWIEFVKFLPFFLVRSLLGGTDVAWRALHPGMPIAPQLLEYPLRLPPGTPRVFMAIVISLLPGTLSAELGLDCVTVHVLDGRQDCLAELAAVEQRVASIFGTSLALGAE